MSIINKNDVMDIDVEYVARLARLSLTDSEIAVFQEQLAEVVDYVRKINLLDLKDIEPTSHGQPVSNVFREDVVRKGIETDDVMRNAPERIGNQFRVPKIVE